MLIPHVNHASSLICYPYQICHSQLLSRGRRGDLSVRHHKVRSRDSESYTNWLIVPSSRASFSNLSRWLADARALGSPNLVVVLVGNKSDRDDDREVEWAEASKWAAENGVSWTLPGSTVPSLSSTNHPCRRTLPGSFLANG